jgi:hypothetical protein
MRADVPVGNPNNADSWIGTLYQSIYTSRKWLPLTPLESNEAINDRRVSV